ncbi:hypothetical protein G6F68_018297 [Rhizopus microsporus]|nr:hypothetical protein G6F68_018297 [Rhizopus microsporus]
MANTILVADSVEAQQGATLSLQLEEEFLSNHMAVIRMYQEKEWMDEATSKVLAQAIRKSTNDAYNRHWKNWILGINSDLLITASQRGEISISLSFPNYP